MNFYLSKNSEKKGPYSHEQIQIFLNQGLLTANDQIWADEWPEWLPIGNVPGLSAQSTEEAVSSPENGLPDTEFVRPPLEPTTSGPLPKFKFGMKNGLIGFILLLFILGVFLIWLGSKVNSNANAIGSILKQNAAFQTNYNAEKNGITISTDSDLDHLAQITQDYASQLKTIDTSVCPSDFRDAFADYAGKVGNLGDALSQHPHVTTDGEAALSVLVIAAIARQGGDAGFNEAGQVVADERNSDATFVRECEQREAEVKDAAASVDSIARKYGVNIQN